VRQALHGTDGMSFRSLGRVPSGAKKLSCQKLFSFNFKFKQATHSRLNGTAWILGKT